VLEIAPIALTHEGHTYRSNALRLVVRQPEPQDRLLVEVSTDKPSYVLGESVTLTLHVLLRKLMTNGKILDVDPFFREQPPHLEIPWFASLGDWKTSDVETFARPFLEQQRPGFTINTYVDKASLFGEPVAICVAPPEYDSSHDSGSEQYFTYQLRKQFRPIRPGVQSIPPVVKTSSRSRSMIAGGRTNGKIIASSAPLSSSTSSPHTGQPASFIGAVDVSINGGALLPPQGGRPLTLSVVLRAGGDSCEAVHAPALHERQTTQDFKVPADPPVQASADAKTFIYTLRPRGAQVRAVPPIEVAYFDPTTGRCQASTAAYPPGGRGGLSMSTSLRAWKQCPAYSGRELTDGISPTTPVRVLVPQMARLQVTA
jgi:hypothetical protein